MVRRLVIDSLCRRIDETVDDYTVEFSESLKADTLALVASDVPFSAWTVSDGCDLVVFEQAGVKHDIRLTHGNVPDIEGLALNLQNAINGVVSGGSVAVNVDDADTGHLVVDSDSAFDVSATACTARLLGLRPRPVSGRDADSPTPVSSVLDATDGRHRVRLPFEADLEPDRYLLLKLDVTAGALTSPAQASDGSVSVLRPGPIDIAHPFACATSRKAFDRMRVTITRIDGSRYDFRGRDHRLEFLIDGP